MINNPNQNPEAVCSKGALAVGLMPLEARARPSGEGGVNSTYNSEPGTVRVCKRGPIDPRERAGYVGGAVCNTHRMHAQFHGRPPTSTTLYCVLRRGTHTPAQQLSGAKLNRIPELVLLLPQCQGSHVEARQRKTNPTPQAAPTVVQVFAPEECSCWGGFGRVQSPCTWIWYAYPRMLLLLLIAYQWGFPPASRQALGLPHPAPSPSECSLRRSRPAKKTGEPWRMQSRYLWRAWESCDSTVFRSFHYCWRPLVADSVANFSGRGTISHRVGNVVLRLSVCKSIVFWIATYMCRVRWSFFLTSLPQQAHTLHLALVEGFTNAWLSHRCLTAGPR